MSNSANVFWTVDLEGDFPKEWTRRDGADMTTDEIAEAVSAGNGVFEFESEADPRYLGVQAKLEELGADFDVFLSERGFPTICW